MIFSPIISGPRIATFPTIPCSPGIHVNITRDKCMAPLALSSGRCPKIITWCGNQAKIYRMTTVFTWRNVFKIFKAVICFDSIFMIYTSAFWSLPEKRTGYNDVDSIFLVNRFVGKKNGRIGIPPKIWLQYSKSFFPSYSSEIRNRIDIFKTDNWLPYFHFPILLCGGKSCQEL